MLPPAGWTAGIRPSPHSETSLPFWLRFSIHSLPYVKSEVNENKQREKKNSLVYRFKIKQQFSPQGRGMTFRLIYYFSVWRTRCRFDDYIVHCCMVCININRHIRMAYDNNVIHSIFMDWQKPVKLVQIGKSLAWTSTNRSSTKSHKSVFKTRRMTTNRKRDREREKRYRKLSLLSHYHVNIHTSITVSAKNTFK